MLGELLSDQTVLRCRDRTQERSYLEEGERRAGGDLGADGDRWLRAQSMAVEVDARHGCPNDLRGWRKQGRRRSLDHLDLDAGAVMPQAQHPGWAFQLEQADVGRREEGA